jgi:hypothetical protein
VAAPRLDLDMHGEVSERRPRGSPPAGEPPEFGERHEARCAGGGIGDLDVQPERGRRATSTLGEQELPADRAAEDGRQGGGRPRHHNDQRRSGECDAGWTGAPGVGRCPAGEPRPQARIGNPGVRLRPVPGNCSRELRRHRSGRLGGDRDLNAAAAHLPVQAVEVLAEVADDRADVAGGGHVHDHRMAGAGGACDDGPGAEREQEGDGDGSREAGQRGCARPALALRAVVAASCAPSSVHGIS